MQIKQRVPPALRRRAAEGTKKKMRLEARLASKLRRFFSKIGNQFRKQLADGVVLDATMFDEELRRILKNHYVKTFGDFSGGLSDTLKSINHSNLILKQNGDIAPENTSEIAEAARKIKPSRVNREVRSERNQFIEERVARQSKFILDTTQKDLNKAAAERQSEALAAIAIGVLITRQQMANNARRDFRDKTTERPAGIAMTETQAVAEEAKQTDASRTVEIAAGTLAAITVLRKVWLTVGDDKVRSAHQAAEGQEQLVTDPFLVNGEQLKTPGDTSLGASPGNTINCRCSAEYSIVSPI